MITDMKKYHHEYYIKNREEVREKQKQYYKNNRQKIIKRSKQRYKDNPEKAIIYQKKWRKDNPEKAKRYHNSDKQKEYSKLYRKNNPEKSKERDKRYSENNYEKYRESQNRCRRNRYKISPKHNLNYKMKRAINRSLKGNKKGRHWENLVGYTLKDLIKRLKKTIPKDYTWQDFLSGNLHIDHIIPISAFNFSSPEHTDFKRCWALNNLRLLPAKENLKKSNKLDKPFQPSLRF